MKVWLRVKKWLKWPLMVIVFYVFVGLFNSLIANDQALLASQNHQLVFPAFYDLAAD